MPTNITDLEVYTAVKNISSSMVLSQIVMWAIVSYIHLEVGFYVVTFFSISANLSMVSLRLGYHRFGRLMYVSGSSVGMIMSAQVYGPACYMWLMPIVGLAGSSFSTAAAETSLRRTLRALAILTFLSCVALNILDPFPNSYPIETQKRISQMGMAITLYCISILFKAIMLYRTEVVLSKKQLENQAVAMLQQAKMSSLGEMAGGVAHEINNPLAMINGHITQIIREIEAGRGNSEKTLEKSKKIQDTVMRISKIVSALRTFSRDAEADPIQDSTWGEILESTCNFCAENLRLNGVDLRITGEQNYRLECRASQISQVLVNMINNAFDAVKQLPEKWIEIHTEMANDQLLISVTDSGHGIPTEVAEKIMQPFFTTKELGKGTGLGLSVSKGIIESHGGNIQLDASCPNTRFVISLPCRAKAQPPAKMAG